MIYLFDKLEQLVEIVDETALIDWRHILQVNQFERATIELPADFELTGVDYFGFFDDEQVFKMFRITNREIDDVLVIEGMDKAESDLRTIGIIQDKRPSNVTAEQALYVALEGTGYQVGEVTGLPTVLSTNFYFISPAEALVKIIEKWNCEFRIRYTFQQNKIVGRYVDLAKRFGKVSGKQFVYGDNALSVLYEESKDEVVTALIGRGRGEQIGEAGEVMANGSVRESDAFGRRIDFSDVVWSTSKGNPVNKPKGQNYLLLESARPNYGLSQNGELKHRWAVWVDDQIEDPEVLIERTWEQLQKMAVPATVFKAKLVDMDGQAGYGDSVAIIRDEVGIAFSARIHKMTIDKLNASRSTVELGDYETLRLNKSANNPVTKTLQEQSLYAQQLTDFYQHLEEQVALKNAEVAEELRLAQLEFSNAEKLAQKNAEAFQDEIKGRIELVEEDARIMVNQVTASDRQIKQILKEAKATDDLAKEAKKIADEGKKSLTSALTELNTVKTTATSLLSEVNGVKRSVSGFETTVSRLGDRIDTKAEMSFVNTLSGKVATHETKITQAVNELSSKVSKTSYDSLAGRVSTAESTLSQHADSLKKQLTSSQVDTLISNKGYQTASQVNTAITSKGYQTKAQVDSNITGRGYITNAALSNYVTATTFTNYQNETSQAIERGLTRVQSLIPSEVGGRNLLRNTESLPIGNKDNGYWVSQSGGNGQATVVTGVILPDKGLKSAIRVLNNTTGNKDLCQGVTLVVGESYTISCWARVSTLSSQGSVHLLFRSWANNNHTNRLFNQAINHKTWKRYSLTFTADTAYNSIQFGQSGGGIIEICGMKLERGRVASDWSPAIEDVTLQTDFNRVKETAELYERILGRTAGDVSINLARQVMTSQLFQTEISSPVSGLSTKMSQLEDGWAVKTLKGNGDILSQLNLNSSGVRIAGKLIHLDGQTLINNGVIKSAMIDTLNAGQIKGGTIDASVIGAGAITANHISGGAITAAKIASGAITAEKIQAGAISAAKIDANGLSADLIKGGYLISKNGNTQFNLDAGNLFFNSDNTGVFRIQANASTQGILFQNRAITVDGQSRVLSRAIFGAERRGNDLPTLWQEGGFNGIVLDTINGIESKRQELSDRVSVVGDRIRFVHTYNQEGDGWHQKATGWEMLTYAPLSPTGGQIILQPSGTTKNRGTIYAGRLYICLSNGSEVSLEDVIRRLLHNTQELTNRSGKGRNNIYWDYNKLMSNTKG